MNPCNSDWALRQFQWVILSHHTHNVGTTLYLWIMWDKKNVSQNTRSGSPCPVVFKGWVKCIKVCQMAQRHTQAPSVPCNLEMKVTNGNGWCSWDVTQRHHMSQLHQPNNLFLAKSKFWKYVPRLAILDDIKILQVPYETRQKSSLLIVCILCKSIYSPIVFDLQCKI